MCDVFFLRPLMCRTCVFVFERVSMSAWLYMGGGGWVGMGQIPFVCLGWVRWKEGDGTRSCCPLL